MVSDVEFIAREAIMLKKGVILRILSDTQPTPDSVTVVPSLEDYYLYVFGDIL